MRLSVNQIRKAIREMIINEAKQAELSDSAKKQLEVLTQAKNKDGQPALKNGKKIACKKL